MVTTPAVLMVPMVAAVPAVLLRLQVGAGVPVVHAAANVALVGVVVKGLSDVTVIVAVAGVTERPVQAVAPPVPDRVSVPAVTTNPGGAVIPAGVPEKSWQ